MRYQIETSQYAGTKMHYQNGNVSEHVLLIHTLCFGLGFSHARKPLASVGLRHVKLLMCINVIHQISTLWHGIRVVPGAGYKTHEASSNEQADAMLLMSHSIFDKVPSLQAGFVRQI